MSLGNIRCLCLGLLMVFSAASVCSAQLSEGLKLRQDSDVRSKIPVSGEFKLSLGSQMMDNNLSLLNPSESDIERRKSNRFEIVENFSDLNSPAFSKLAIPEKINFKRIPESKSNSFGAVLTLNTSYYDNNSLSPDNEPEKLSIAKESGKLKFYGEFEQRFVSQPLNANNIKPANGLPESKIRASVIGENTETSQEPSDKNAAMTSRYYLEAVYNFRPSLKGKVSFKRAMIDTFESEESLQVEGIVEANRNILIKAGYNNEIRPEVSEPKSSKDTKVWTEFILKF